jgi:L-rhamnose isomerase/sugar isomerase
MMVDFGNHQPERPLYDLLKIEETIQTVMKAQELYAKAALVDHRALAVHQAGCALIDAEECLKEAFSTDVRPLIQAWRRAKGLTENPLGAYRASGYQDRIAKERAAKNATAGGSYA